MKTFTVTATVDCRGIYTVEAETEEEAIDLFEQWAGWGDDKVSFSHYAEEIPGDVISVEED